MATHVIKMPDLGEGIAEVELVAWRVAPGETVAEDQILADVMTDKATVEIPSPVAGSVLALGGEVGQVLLVGAELIRLEVSGAATSPSPAPAALPEQAPTAAAAGSGAGAAGHRAAGVAGAAEASSIPVASAPVALPATRTLSRPIASPAVRRRAWDSGVALEQVPGTGTAGRIVQADLDRHLAEQGAGASTKAQAQRPAALLLRPPPAAVAGPVSAGQTLPLQPREGTLRVPVVGLRRRIAQRMQDAKRHVPHFTYVEEVDVTELESLRVALNARHAGHRPKLTVLPFLVRALVLTLPDFPGINAHFDDEQGVVTQFSAVHVGIATQTGAGLMVPVMRHAETADLWACAAEIARVAELARGGRATRDELSGSTLTITSLGPLGGIVTTPIVNRPEVAIVGVNRIVERPMMRGGAVVGRKMMNLSSSFDHRVVDGHEAARFVQALRMLLECPAMLFID